MDRVTQLSVTAAGVAVALLSPSALRAAAASLGGDAVTTACHSMLLFNALFAPVMILAPQALSGRCVNPAKFGDGKAGKDKAERAFFVMFARQLGIASAFISYLCYVEPRAVTQHAWVACLGVAAVKVSNTASGPPIPLRFHAGEMVSLLVFAVATRAYHALHYHAPA